MTGKPTIEELTEKYDNAYRLRTPRSRESMEMAARFLPGGDSRITTFFYPYPLVLESGKGCRVVDVDGNEYIDFHNCYTAAIHGHAHRPVVSAVQEVMETIGFSVGAPTALIAKWAEALCRRVSSVERVRFCNSGTEAVMMAIRTCRAFSKKDLILKPEGGYNGSYDAVVYPPDVPGLTHWNRSEQLLVPFNNEDALQEAVRENKDRLACVIIEGIMGAAGQIVPKPGYLAFVRKVTQEAGVLMVLDEVMTFRLDYGGIQRAYGIEPDLTVFGKFIGGGFPVGAWGSREEIMDMLNPVIGRLASADSVGLPATAHVFHGGTFNANPVVATAGRITLEHLGEPVIARLNELGERLAKGIREVFRKLGLRAQLTGLGSLWNLHFTPEIVVDFKTAQTSAKDLMHLVHLGLLERGIFLPARGLFALSTPMTEREIDTATAAVGDVLRELRPAVEILWPEMLV